MSGSVRGLSATGSPIAMAAVSRQDSKGNISMAKREDLTVFIATRESKCDDCGEELARKAWISLAGDRGALCLSCADLDHLVFLPSGDAALTRRSRKHSTLCAVVLKWSPARKRSERQGILVEELAVQKAEEECLADQDARARRCEREAVRRARLDRQYVERFAERVRELYPSCPPGVEMEIAEHACLKYSGRVGRSAAAKALDDDAIRFAVVARIRHLETPYDQLLANGWERHAAREEVRQRVLSVLTRWQGESP